MAGRAPGHCCSPPPHPASSKGDLANSSTRRGSMSTPPPSHQPVPPPRPFPVPTPHPRPALPSASSPLRPAPPRIFPLPPLPHPCLLPSPDQRLPPPRSPSPLPSPAPLSILAAAASPPWTLNRGEVWALPDLTRMCNKPCTSCYFLCHKPRLQTEMRVGPQTREG